MVNVRRNVLHNKGRERQTFLQEFRTGVGLQSSDLIKPWINNFSFRAFQICLQDIRVLKDH